jgi:hypothetical protein
MKKILVIPLLLSFHFAYAGTGSANDEILFMLVIIAILLFILAVLYSIDFIRKIIKEHRDKKTSQLADKANGENISPTAPDIFEKAPSEES